MITCLATFKIFKPLTNALSAILINLTAFIAAFSVLGRFIQLTLQLQIIRQNRDKELFSFLFPILQFVNNNKELFDSISPSDEVVLCGGDGTLNFLINEFDCDTLENRVYYYPTGSGNDFWNDLGKKDGDAPVLINDYIVRLPSVIVNGMTRKFINGIGYGIDGYCCEEGDRQRTKAGDKPINYTSIAIKGLLFHYKPTRATITVNGETHVFDKAWLAPTMNGRFYGGGMMATPDQDRLNPARTVTTMVMYGKGKIGTLAVFPSIFKGEHVNKTNIVKTFVSNRVKVAFDRPVALQIDGETVLNVREYEVITAE